MKLKFRAFLDVDVNLFIENKKQMVYFEHCELDNGLWFDPVDKNINHINKWLSKPMQSTGLKDIEGNLIYEGDLLRCNDKESIFYSEERSHYYFEIKWDKYKFNAFPITNQNEEDFRAELNAYGSQIMWPDTNVLNNHWHYKIIGNIIENPELLNKSVYEKTCI